MKVKNIIIILLVCILTIGCNFDQPNDIKTEYKVREDAIIDNYNIKLLNYNYSSQYNNLENKNGQYLILTFEIKNNFKESKIIDKDNFVISIKNQTYQAIMNNAISISPHNSKQVIIAFDVPQLSEYGIIFYSKVVTNNIMFKVS